MDFEFGHLATPRNRRATIMVTIFSVERTACAPASCLAGCRRLSWRPASIGVRYSLFLGLAMAITAVPILGRILRQYGLTRTEVGVVAISGRRHQRCHRLAPSISDICLRRPRKFSAGHLSIQLGGLLVFVLLLWLVLQPAATYLLKRLPAKNGELDPNLMAIVLCVVFALGYALTNSASSPSSGGFAGRHAVSSRQGFCRRLAQPSRAFRCWCFFLPVFFHLHRA